MLDWIKREPIRFGGVVQSLFALVAVVVGMLLPETMDTVAKVAITGPIIALGNAVAEFVRTLAVPAVKLDEATVKKAAGITQAEINKGVTA